MNPLPRSIEVLERFFAQMDNGTLFATSDPRSYQDARQEIRATLNNLLVWERPGLESAKGIDWPYQGFRRGYRFVADHAERADDGFQRKQATLFLALLPFPGQWRWLLEAEKRYRGDPELRAFLAGELRDILNKIEKKPQNGYKLRHFCQILKRPELPREKGVLRVFSLPYLFVTQPQLLGQLSHRYVLYVEPPMGIVYRHAWWRYFARLEDPCIMGVGSLEDRNFLQGQPGVMPVLLAHGDYMEEDDWQDGGRDDWPKEHDIVFNATYDDMPRKRHRLMLELLQHPALADCTALFLGRGQQANVAELRSKITEMGLGSRVTVLANLRRADVPAQLRRCKVGVHLSLYENACRGIYEFLRSDLPCVIPSCMGGMNPALFNAETGLAVAERDLPDAIRFVLQNRQRFSPRHWFVSHSGSVNSSRTLNATLKELFSNWGYDWGQDIVPLGSSGASRYVQVHQYRAFGAEFEWLLGLFRTIDKRKLTFSIE